MEAMEAAHLIVGLGNPGAKYERTRHNAGFQAVEHLAAQWGAGWADEKKKFSMSTVKAAASAGLVGRSARYSATRVTARTAVVRRTRLIALMR